MQTCICDIFEIFRPLSLSLPLFLFLFLVYPINDCFFLPPFLSISSGIVAERVDLRYFLTVGMIGMYPFLAIILHFYYIIGSAISTGMLGVAYFANIYHLYYFIIWMAISGIMQVGTDLTNLPHFILSYSSLIVYWLAWYCGSHG